MNLEFHAGDTEAELDTKSPDAFRTISEVAEDLDIPQHVLRFWETRFSQIKPLKRGGGRRYYRPDDVALLKGIRRLLYGEGYTIKGLQRILKEQGPRHVQAIGRGAPIGALVRMRHADTSYGAMPRDFTPGGIPIGTRAGICVVPPPTDAVREQIAATVRRQTPRGQVLTLHTDAILLADCGSSGRWALVTWTQVEQSETTEWIDELRYDGGGRWTGTPPRTYPGCRMPLAAAAAWQVDVRRCGPGARRAPSTPRAAPRRAQPTPPRTTPQPQPGPRPPEPAPLDSVTI